jgi:hypothetical protein
VLLVVLVPLVGATVVVVVLVVLAAVVFELVGSAGVVLHPEIATAMAATAKMVFI